MASRLNNPHGLDRECAAKTAAKTEPKRLKQALDWISGVTKEKLSGNFQEDLKSGVVLCKLINAISPGAVKRFKDSRMPFIQRENITNYVKACKKLGMRETDVFVTDDLFSGNDLSVVLMQIFSLSKISLGVHGFQGPYVEDYQDGDIIPEQVSLVENRVEPVPPPPQPKQAAPPPPPPKAKAAPPLPSRASISESSKSTSSRTSISSGYAGMKAPSKKPRKLQSVLKKVENKDNPLVPKSDRRRGGKMAEIERLVGTSSEPKAKSAPPPGPAGAKRNSNAPKPKFKNRQDECVWWVQTVSGIPVEGGFQDGLKSGVALCKLVNTIAPGTIKKFRNKAKLSKFECLENIAAYCKGVRKLGVAEHELFVSNDLYEGNSLMQVANSIVAFSNISRDLNSFDGPYIGIAVVKKQARDFSGKKMADAVPFTSRGAMAHEPERKLDSVVRY